MEHTPGYFRRDWNVVDYQMYCLARTGLWFRGPEPEALNRNQYFTCIGAAQTVGCFCKKPYPALLQEKLNVYGLNLGYGGSGPSFFLKYPALLEYINNGKFTIVQVMSGRSESNSLFESGGLEYLKKRSDGVFIGANDAYQELLRHEARLRIKLGGRELFFLPKSVAKIDELIAETRLNWLKRFSELLKKIETPKILLYFSKRKPEYKQHYYSVSALFGDFPQLITASMLDGLKDYCDYNVHCISRRGSPQLLINRFTGKRTTVDLSLDRKDFQAIWKYNKYYPSPEMHADASTALEPVCKKILTT